ncbi:condensation domain-containing protein [Streptomyces sp. NBC_00151]|uniref:condensation domain-containing protein n=1 Tax=Streptomyces sp. NBC_00151 TaxID=2975669 RepID=UPI002DDB64C5|nr:condensation domain-containing protein [Streptomyces sp. NBC_00151]WRZ40370.1 condensation domain-containing protein [Streptomyces sp. NBC_00151]
MTGTHLSKTDLDARWRLEESLLRTRPGRDGRPAATERPPGGTELRFRASVAQEGMWQSLRGGPGSTPALIAGGLRLSGPLDTAALEEAWNDVAARHDNLRSSLRMEDGRLRQVIAPSVRLSVPVVDLAPGGLERFTRQEVDLSFDLSAGPLARLRLLKTAPDEHIAFLIMHHIIGDGRALEVLVRDLGACYLARAAGGQPVLPPLPLRYGDFAESHRALVEGVRAAEVSAYWVERLRGAVPAELPTDLRPPTEPTPYGALLDVPVPQEVFRRLDKLARSARTTVYTLGLAAFQVTLSRASGQRDICVRAPISYRDGADVQDLVADFSNDVVVRTDLSGNPTFTELIAKVAEETNRDFMHHDVPAHLLEPHLDEPGLLDRLFHVQFTAENDIAVAAELGELSVERVIPPMPYISRPLSLRLRYDESGARSLAIYSTDVFSQGRVVRFVEEFHAVLAEMAVHGERRVFGQDLGAKSR